MLATVGSIINPAIGDPCHGCVSVAPCTDDSDPIADLVLGYSDRDRCYGGGLSCSAPLIPLSGLSNEFDSLGRFAVHPG